MQPSQLKNLWQQVLIEARDFLSEAACAKWLDPLKPLALEKNVLILSASDDLQKQWVEDRYLSKLEEAFFDLSGEHLSIELKTMRRKPKTKPENEIQMTLAMNEEKITPTPPQENLISHVENSTLNPRYTFEAKYLRFSR